MGSVMLSELEKAIEEVRDRRRLLLQLRELYDSEQPPEMVPISLDFGDLDGGCSTTSSRITRSSRNLASSLRYDNECTFAPAISERSRRIASRLDRDHEYKKSTASTVEPLKKAEKPEVSAVTAAIANRIKKTYGSLEEYYRQRKENAISYKDLTSKKETEELKECTFHPAVKRVESHAKVLEKAPTIEGLDSFVQRLEKARQKRLTVSEHKKPGSGQMYTGEPTKVEPFSFLNRPQSNRARIRE
jgi:hypothetical protein